MVSPAGWVNVYLSKDGAANSRHPFWTNLPTSLKFSVRRAHLVSALAKKVVPLATQCAGNHPNVKRCIKARTRAKGIRRNHCKSSHEDFPSPRSTQELSTFLLISVACMSVGSTFTRWQGSISLFYSTAFVAQPFQFKRVQT